MSWFQVVLLALVQGVTEFLPISSSGHLIIPAAVFGWEDQGLAFDVAVHAGSLGAVLLYFRSDLQALFRGWIGSLIGHASDEGRLAWAVVIATIPAGLCGLLLDGWIETNLRSLAVIGCASIGFGLLLAWSDRAPQSRSELGALRWRDAIWVGCAQALALIPGTSRSGITMTAGRALGFDRATAARFSFLLSIPLILAAGMLKGLDLWQSPQPGVWGQAVVGALV